MASRKTIKVEDVKDRVNGFIAAHAANVPDGQATRMGMIDVLEAVLHDTGNYKGFRYLASTSQVHAGNYDESARRYF